MPESCEQAEILAQSWAWLAKRTEHTALMCADAGVHPYDLRRALAPVPIGWRIEMTDVPTVPPTHCAVPPPPPPPRWGRRDDADLRELRRVRTVEAPLTCGYCRCAPATHVLVAYYNPMIGRRVEMVCKPCGDWAMPHSAPVWHTVQMWPVQFSSPEQVPMGNPDRWVDPADISDPERKSSSELARLRLWLHARSMHPDYEYQTTKGPRKAWDDAGKPPPGPGWERNTDRGIAGEGWERFDYHEESYWRRPTPVPCEACADTGYELLNDRPTGNPCPVCRGDGPKGEP